MMRRFHDGALEALSPWRLFDEPRSSCVRCTRTVFCNAGLRSVSCAYPNASCHGGGGGGGGVEVLRRHIAETWPIFVPQAPSSSSSSYPTDRRSWSKGSPRNAASSETGNRIGGANPMPFSITSILGRQAAAAAAAAASEDRNQASQRKIVRPWDDKVSFCDRGRSKTLRKSSTKIGDSVDDDEEEINVGQDGARSARRLESTGNKDCPLDALLRMTSKKQFERSDTAAASGYTSDGKSAFHPLCTIRSNIYTSYLYVYSNGIKCECVCFGFWLIYAIYTLYAFDALEKSVDSWATRKVFALAGNTEEVGTTTEFYHVPI